MEDFDSLVVGGGLLGCMVAAHLAKFGGRVLLVEKGPALLGRGSLADQGRLHLAFPQATDAARRARHNLQRFTDEFRDCVAEGHASFHAVCRSAKVTAGQIDALYRQVGVSVKLAPEPVRRLFDPAHIEAVFLVEEVVIDVARLRHQMEDRLAAAGAEVRLATSAQEVKPLPGGSLRVQLPGGAVRARQVFNCAGSRLNEFQHRSGLPPLPLRHELTEVVYVDGPPQLQHSGMVIHGGPSFSLTPSPSTTHLAFQQARFAAHAAWADLGPEGPAADEVLARVAHQTGFERMRREAGRFVPCLGDLRYRRSVWEVKASPTDADAPFVLRAHAGCRNLHAVLGSRIDGVFDALDCVDRLLGERSRAAA
ncbi:MAG: FAD-dependent oxidoreductase [Gemmataceae bacterium]